MIATLPYIEEKYREYNNLIFGGKLPEVQIQLSRARTFLGAVTSKRKRNWWGKIEHYDYRLRISTRFDLPQDELDDIIIHEMIHYYIAVNKLKDTSAHGRIFRQMMADINTRYGRHITISYRLTIEQKQTNYIKMKNSIFTLVAMFATLTVSAQDIKLPQPETNQKSMTVVEALKTRHSVRNFDATKVLDNQQLSNLCWAACGMTRTSTSSAQVHRTAPTAMNRQEVRLFAFTKKAVYEYDAKANALIKKADGDHRDLLAGAGGNPANGRKGFRQEFVMDAPVTLVMVIDYDIFGKQDEKAVMMGCVDAGNISENINLYCQAVGLVTVPRATMDIDGIRKLLGFTDKQLPIMNNPVGYEKK